MRLILVEFNPSGGLFQFAFQLGRALALRGHDVELVTGPDPELRSDVPGLRLTSLAPTWHPAPRGVERPLVRKVRRVGRALRYVEAWRRLSRHLRAHPPDVVQWAAWRFTVDGVFVRLLARRHPRPVLVDLLHEPRPYFLPADPADWRRHRGLRWSLDGAFRRLDAVLVLGEQAREVALAVWPGIRRVEVIPHGDQNVFRSDDAAPVEHTPPTVLFFGTLLGYKGLDVLMDAVADLRVRLPAVRLVVAGAPGDVDVAELRRRAREVGGVTVEVGYVPIDDVPRLFGSARLVAVPYRQAAQSGVVHLAYRFGRPVVASAVGDIPSVVLPGRTGQLVPPGDAGALAEAMEPLLRDARLAARLGGQGRDHVDASASWAAVAGRVEQVYEALLRDRSRPPR